MVLIYLQYKMMKLRSLCDLIEKAYKIYFEMLNKNINHIKKIISKIRVETEIIQKQFNPTNFIQTGKNIFLLWKKKKKDTKFKYKYEDFIKILRLAIKEVDSLKIDDEVIIDQITSCWLIKNELDDYVLN